MTTELKVVMFTDQVGSTANSLRRTHAETRQVAREQDSLTFEAVRQCRGRILKDTGDGHFIEFSSCSDAVRCGFLVQKLVTERNAAQTNDRLEFELHIGIDFGEAVVLPNGDLRANTANLAARVCEQCPPGDVYFTRKVKDELHPDEARVESVGKFQLKGVDGETEIFRLVEWLGTIEGFSNPFVWRGPITDGEAFFDREGEQHTLRDFLRGRQNCQIVGARRIGKTSLLKQIERGASEWDPSAMVACIDLQDPRCHTLGGFLDLGGRRFGWPGSVPSLVECSEQVDTMLADGRHPVLCLDEFEEFTLRRGEFTRDFFLTLRSCAGRGMSIVTASMRPLSELTEKGDPTSPFYNAFPILSLGPFSEKDAEDFVSLYRVGAPPFTRKEKAAILEFAGGHPLALQVACFHVLGAKEQRGSLSSALGEAGANMRAALRSWGATP